jgi:cation diffusion facilitator CzcD-associated flavoprotein CzcO
VSATPTGDARTVIVGTGFAGLGTAIRLKQRGDDDFIVLERADDVGGTWRDNTYPGCQCDVPSTLYSFSFAPNPNWTSTYPLQQEIWDYLRDCATRFDVMPHIRFGHEVTGARWDEQTHRWHITTNRGDFTAQLLVLGNGPLSEPAMPDFPGLETFTGTVFHSARWQHDHDLRGERVAVVGTGASAIQFIPEIQPKVANLQLYQRTPPWVLPHPKRATTSTERRLYQRVPISQLLLRASTYVSREAMVLGFSFNQRLMRALEWVALKHMRNSVRDVELQRELTPNYRIGCKRILISDDYYPAIVKPNVELITGRIREIRPTSIVSEDGTEREVDTIILATGFRVTDPPIAQRVRGAGGKSLADVWQGSPQAYRGTTVAGFPNMFMLAGPNTGLGHTSLVYMIESQIAYVLDCLRFMDEAGATMVEVRPEVQARYNQAIQARLAGTVWLTGGCASWYIDATGRNSTLWPTFTWPFRQRTAHFDAPAYALSNGTAAHRAANAVPAAV